VRGVIVLAVFVVLLAYGILHHGRSHHSSDSPPAPPAAFAVTDAGSACRAWDAIGPVIARDVQAGDRNGLFQLETTGGPQHEYGAMMRWAELAYARQESVVLAADLTVVQTRVSGAASGSEAIGDLPVPVAAVTGQCQGPPPGSGGGVPA
jgi:hypothetical protein